MINLIWDLDGTIFDSYSYVVKEVQTTLSRLGLEYDSDYIHTYIIVHSIDEFAEEVCADNSIPVESFYEIFDSLNHADTSIGLMPNTKELFEKLGSSFRHFVVTNRNPSAHDILSYNGMLDVFTEVVDSSKGFKRKPCPDSILYLIEKYGLERDSTYYVGDRQLDIDAAANAGIGSIYYRYDDISEDASGETYRVGDLLEIAALFGF